MRGLWKTLCRPGRPPRPQRNPGPGGRAGFAADPAVLAQVWAAGEGKAFKGSKNQRRNFKVPPAPFINLFGTILTAFCVGNLQVLRHPVFTVCSKALAAEQRACSFFRMQTPQCCTHLKTKFAPLRVAIYLTPYGRKKLDLSDCYVVSLKRFK